jgi:ribosomal protein S27AE
MARQQARWVCDYCGDTGTVPDDELVERVQCPTCGEPVLPLPWDS